MNDIMNRINERVTYLCNADHSMCQSLPCPTSLMQNHLNALTSLTSDVFDDTEVVVVGDGPE